MLFQEIDILTFLVMILLISPLGLNVIVKSTIVIPGSISLNYSVLFCNFVILDWLNHARLKVV